MEEGILVHRLGLRFDTITVNGVCSLGEPVMESIYATNDSHVSDDAVRCRGRFHWRRVRCTNGASFVEPFRCNSVNWAMLGQINSTVEMPNCRGG